MKIIQKKRRREKKTNYDKRRRLLEGNKGRIVIRKTNRYATVQYVESTVAQDKIIKSINSRDFIKLGWPKEKQGSLKSLAAFYLAGYSLGKEIGTEKECVIDTGLIRSTKGSRVYAAIKGLIDAGVKIKASKEMLPSEDRIKNERVKDFFDKVKENLEKQGGKE